jgi:nucleoside-diphosphate-sugar epimerase
VRPLRAMVTGDTGFIGRHMRAELEHRGWDVAGCDLKIGSDARDVFLSDDTVYDLVVHCAYHVGGRAAIDGEPRLLARNLELDARMFDWAVRTGQRRVLYYSSSAAYPIRLQEATAVARILGGNYDRGRPWIPLEETMIDSRDLEQPDARYGWAKLTGEQLAESARLSGLQVHVVRPFSGYSHDQDMTYPFPAILHRVLSGELSVWGPPGQYRDWVHVDDVIGCSLAVVDQDIDYPVNICSGTGVEMGDLAIRMARIAGVTVPDKVTYLRDKPTGVMARVGSPDKMIKIYRPTINLEEGIRRAIVVARDSLGS